MRLPPTRTYPTPYNDDHDILRMFDALPNFSCTTSETKPDYSIKLVYTT